MSSKHFNSTGNSGGAKMFQLHSFFKRCTYCRGCLVQVGNGMELDTFGHHFNPYL